MGNARGHLPDGRHFFGLLYLGLHLLYLTEILQGIDIAVFIAVRSVEPGAGISHRDCFFVFAGDGGGMPSPIVEQGGVQAGKRPGKFLAEDLAGSVAGYDFRRPVEGGYPVFRVNGDDAGIDVVKDLLVEKRQPVIIDCGLEQFRFRLLESGREHGAQDGNQEKSEAVNRKGMEQHLQVVQLTGVGRDKAGGIAAILDQEQGAEQQGAQRGKEQTAPPKKHESPHDNGEKIDHRENRLVAAGGKNQEGHQKGVQGDLHIAEAGIALDHPYRQGGEDGEQIEPGNEIGQIVQGGKKDGRRFCLEKDADPQHQGEKKHPEKEQPLDLFFEMIIGGRRAGMRAEGGKSHGALYSDVIFFCLVAEGSEAHF